MGCCSSIPASAYPHDARANHNSSSRAIITSSPALAQAPTGNAPTSAPRRHRSALTKQVNKPLKPHVWESQKKWTRQTLDRDRREFFETRVAGREEIWQTLRSALEVMWAGGEEADNDGGLATAQMILSAAEITLPTGDLASGAYDSHGVFYQLPENVVSDPTNVFEESVEAPEEDDEEENQEENDEEDEEEDEAVLMRREEKGKRVIAPGDVIEVTARRSDGQGDDMVVSSFKQESVRALTKKIVEEAALPPELTIKLAYMGKILNEKRSLGAQGWQEGHIVQALVFGLGA